MNKTTEALPTPQSQRDLGATGGAGLSYMVSSHDLRSGLEVRLLAATQLPAELLRELLRLHACWQNDAVRAAAGTGDVAGYAAA